ncbi:hypothetical protein [Legionella israelensis]|uniref:RNA binding protein (Contains ribosomal protein S1 domain) n=1 Tax=Legionella israelensis TaxID=454 RepID=A0A0W0WE02_9GAMM|nr:hypothetical protein [Legionella israelensis]KTD30602.1 RNA binding protein (contains ribosomal protein S1 domain) [Legionella israelensis]QBS10766.1 hypothetical protein E4T55_13525 [Legionella israelensis]QDP73019.1 hypothetical protein FOG18_10810 [Legionella israelensis]SCY32237.1 hypothetical protein SAMN02746069_02025 [Legionella israelensis DSM 19235]STX57737.1 RNA binding protein (contains ribosomal protein S1 domain) [Legionella israelensis]
MQILYIPFPESEVGELRQMAEQWKKNLKTNFNESIQILCYQEEFDEGSLQELQIYILGHGFTDSPDLRITNISNVSSPLCKIIDPETVASRFQEDFMIVNSQIKTVHLYVCGTESKNKQLAETFQKYLCRQDFPSIHFYSGSVSIPDDHGNAWSFSNGNPSPLFTKANLIRKTLTTETHDHEDHKKPVKQKLTTEDFRKKNLHRFWKINKENRAKAILKIREENSLYHALTQ